MSLNPDPHRLIDTHLLHALEQRWHKRGAETSSFMEPGLTDDEIDHIAAPLGFPLPEELRVLYRWHDGSCLSEMIWGRSLLPLREVVHEALTVPDWDELRRPGWLRILDERPYVGADCTANGPDGPVPVWHYGPDWEPPTRPVFSSIGEMVQLWIDLIDKDLMYWDGRLWQIRAQDTPEDILEKLTGVPQR